MISNVTSQVNAYDYTAKSEATSAQGVEPSGQRPPPPPPPSSEANFDTYTMSEDATAYLASAMSEVAEEEEVTGTTDTTVEDLLVEEEVADADTKVEVEEEVEEEEVDVEEEPTIDDLMEDLDSSYSTMTTAEVSLIKMTNQMNTLTAMLNAASDDATHVSAESWVSDASTYSYAGKYLAMSAAGTHGVQQDSSTTTETESVAKDYNEYSTTGADAVLSYDELLEKYEAEDSTALGNALLGVEVDE